jgi:hypothetical protein
MSEYVPNRWELIQFKGKETNYKILGSWSGGYVDGDSWRLSSGVKSIEDGGDFYLVKNHSGSLYRCRKTSRGMNIVSAGVFDSILDEAKLVDGLEVSIIDIKDYLKGGINGL